MMAEKITEELIKKSIEENTIKKSLNWPAIFIPPLLFLLIALTYNLWFTWLRHKSISQDDGIFINYLYENISKSPEQWGQFGDFIGGVLNSAFSSITLIFSFIMMRESQKNHHQTMALQVTMAKMQRDEIDFTRKQHEKGNAGILSLYKSKIEYGTNKAKKFIGLAEADKISANTICAFLYVFIESVQIAHERRIYEIINEKFHSEVCELISFEVEFNSLLKQINKREETNYKADEIIEIIKAVNKYIACIDELLEKLQTTPH